MKPDTPNCLKYANCMDVLKTHVSDIEMIFKSEPVTEITIGKIALNYRKVFELIIHACQIAHGHKINKSSKSWNIKDVERIVQKYNSNYFMKAVSSKPDAIEHREDRPTLTLPELKTGYELTGEWLHARNPFLPERDISIPTVKFPEWLPLLKNLLEAHVIEIDSDHFLYSCLNANGTGGTHVSYFSKMDPQPD